jgi:acetyl esterase/lipase
MHRTLRTLLFAFVALAACTVHAQGARIERDVAYGPDRAQRFDVYLPDKPNGNVMLMVHGGGWDRGDKSMRTMVEPKVRYWVPRGWVFVSTNYRMLPTPVAEQAADVARAMAEVQKRAPSWGADPKRLVLMGHSAGAHLVTLLNSDPSLATKQGAQPWRGTVALDSAAMDVPAVMKRRHLPLYDRAFGSDPAQWEAVSPWHVLTPQAHPVLIVCSRRRGDSCPQASWLEQRAATMKLQVLIWAQDMSHAEINHLLGEPGAYSDAVDRWISSIL